MQTCDAAPDVMHLQFFERRRCAGVHQQFYVVPIALDRVAGQTAFLFKMGEETAHQKLVLLAACCRVCLCLSHCLYKRCRLIESVSVSQDGVL